MSYAAEDRSARYLGAQIDLRNISVQTAGKNSVPDRANMDEFAHSLTISYNFERFWRARFSKFLDKLHQQSMSIPFQQSNEESFAGASLLKCVNY